MVLAVVWLVVAVAAALLLGGAIRIAERRAPMSDHLVGLPDDLTVDDVLGRSRPVPTP
ncbi:hypothetical protein [Modestobacter sp. URMC 112]